MARTFFTSDTDSNLSSDSSFNKQLLETGATQGTIQLSANSGGGTATGSYYTIADVPGADGTSTGTFTIRTNIATAQGGVNFRANLMRVNSSGTVQATVLGTYAAAAAGMRTQTFNSPALGTWLTGQRFRIQYQIQNTNSHGGARAVDFETGVSEQDTPFAAPANPVTVTPTTASLTTAAFAPTVTASAGDDITVTPSTASLTFTSFAPTVTAGGAAQTLTPLTVGNAVSGTWSSAPNGALGDNSDSTHGYVVDAAGTYDHLWEMGDVDTDLANMVTLAIVLRYGWNPAPFEDTWPLLAARVMASDGTTVLAAATSGGAFETVASSITTTTPTNSSSVEFTYVNTTATKEQWNGARVEIRITRDTGAFPGLEEQRVYEADLTGTYAVAGTGVTVTPITASLTTSLFAPTVTVPNPQLVTPSTASLSTTGLAPSVTATNHQTVTPTISALTTTTFVASVGVSANQSVTPGNVSLALSAFAPTVTASAHVTATPGLASLVMTGFAPTVNAGAGVTVEPAAASLTTSGLVPTIAISDHQTVSPSPASLTTAAFAPSVETTAHQTLTPTTAALGTTGFAPTVIAAEGLTLVPDTASLSVTGLAPTVSVSDHQSVVPSPASLSLATFIPAVIATDPKTVTPSPAGLTLTSFAPVVGAGVTAVPTTASLSLSAFAPDVMLSDNQFVTPQAASLALQTFAATVTATAPQVVTPGTVSLTLAAFGPIVSTAPIAQGPVPGKITASVVLVNRASSAVVVHKVQPVVVAAKVTARVEQP